jgi:hypothetical protein
VSTHSSAHQHCPTCQTRNLVSASYCYFCGHNLSTPEFQESVYLIEKDIEPSRNAYAVVNWGEGDVVLNQFVARVTLIRDWFAQEDRLIFFSCFFLFILIYSVLRAVIGIA